MCDIKTKYYTLRSEEETKIEEKKSIFICNMKNVESEEDARSFISSVRKKYNDAKHNVYAYVIGQNSEIQKCSDDGEPHGTAGMPVLQIILKKKLTNTAAVVTRYFGGILLGASGLIRTYARAAKEAVDKSEKVEVLCGNKITLTFDYGIYDKLQYFFNNNNIKIEKTSYTDVVKTEFYCENKNLDCIKKNIIDYTNNKLKIEAGKNELLFKLNDGKLILKE